MCINLGNGAQFRIGSEDQIDPRCRAQRVARAATCAFKQVFVLLRPRRVHIEQADKPLIGEGLTVAPYAMAVGRNAKGAQTADQHRHFSRRQTQKLGLIEQHFFRRYGKGSALEVTEAVSCRFQHRKAVRIGLRF